MKEKFKLAFMDVAERFSQLSPAKRLQVGAIIVKEDRIVSIGYNGSPAGWDNDCEERVYMESSTTADLAQSVIEQQWPYEDEHGRYALKTKPEVLHAERNALDKLARGTESGKGAEMFVTHAPCLECAKSIYGAGITVLYYKNNYRSTDGLEFLNRCGVKTEKLDENN